MYRKEEKPYHIDYIFAPYRFFPEKVQVNVGACEDWLQLSDHMPLSIVF